MKVVHGIGFFLLIVFQAAGADSWLAALDRMPLGARVSQLNRTNCVTLMLNAFQSNDVVKALIFMPGATDEFYMFRRAKATMTNGNPTLRDAIFALTNQSHIQATFYPPFLLLHTDEDVLEPLITVKYPLLKEKLMQTPFVPHASYNDRDWGFVQPVLQQRLKADIQPPAGSPDSFHFYRHSFAAWNLTGWEALQAVALAGKSRYTLQRKPPLTIPRNEIVFECDRRIGKVPKIDSNTRIQQ